MFAKPITLVRQNIFLYSGFNFFFAAGIPQNRKDFAFSFSLNMLEKLLYQI